MKFTQTAIHSRAKATCFVHSVAIVLVLALCVPIVAASEKRREKRSEPAAQAPVEVIDITWKEPLSTGSPTLSGVLEAISGKKNKADIENLTKGVVSITREADRFVLRRTDGAMLELPNSSVFGGKMSGSLTKSEENARNKIGEDAALFVHNISALVCEGDEVQLRHKGGETLVVPLPFNQPYLPVKLKELQLSTIKMRLTEENGQRKLRDLRGIVAVVSTGGIDLKIEPREFWRYKDTAGNTNIHFGIKSWLPGPMRAFLRLPEVVHFHFTIRKKDEKHHNHERSQDQADKAEPSHSEAGEVEDPNKKSNSSE